MAWIVSTSYESDPPSLELHPDDKAYYETMQANVYRTLLANIDYKKLPQSVGLNSGFRFPVPDKPLRYQVLSGQKSISHLMPALIGYAVSESVIEIIEELEPGVHRYWPIEITITNGEKSEPRWLLNICNRLDTISREHSTVVDISKGERPILWLKEGPKKLVSYKDKIGNCALWCEFGLRGSTAMSNALFERLEQLGLGNLEPEFEIQEI